MLCCDFIEFSNMIISLIFHKLVEKGDAKAEQRFKQKTATNFNCRK